MTEKLKSLGGGCEWFAGGIKVQYTRCEPCMFGAHPGGLHDWAGIEDVEHAEQTGQPDPSGQKCGCTCVDEPSLAPEPPDDDEDEATGPNPCLVCGAPYACGYDTEGRPLIHALGEEYE